jgi:ribose 5-phosphate isomerase B
MRIAVGADHAGFEMKEKLKEYLEGLGHDVLDHGTPSQESVDYPDFGYSVGKAVATGEAERGVVVCGTGLGIAMAANKVSGVRAAAPNDLFAARLMREHNNANVIAFGARLTAFPLAEAMLDVFLTTPFAGGRHGGRVEKLNAGPEGAAGPESGRKG